MDVAGHDADLAFVRRDDTGAVGSDQPRLRARKRALHLDHVEHRNALGDADDQRQFGVDRLQNGVGRVGRRHVDRGGGRTGRLASDLGLTGKQVAAFSRFLPALYATFTDLDCSIVEINPLVVTDGGDVVALDAKISFDDSASFRHAELEKLRDEGEEDPKELEAAKYNLNYVALDGNIGCLVNGAGLAMATMDIIKLYGATPANFLDVGGGATKERVSAAFKIILSDPNVEGILVNIFGGIMRCDVIAEGVVAAAREVKLSVPLVVRLEGTNVQLGKEILAKSNLPIISADNLGDAAEKIVTAVREAA